MCETKDLVKVGVRADVFYSIVDPEKCIQTLNTDELEDLVRETAVATLTNIIRSTALNQIAQSRTISASSAGESAIVTAVSAVGEDGEDLDEDAVDPQQAAVSYFFDRAHDEFMSKLHEDFVTRYGVDIANIRMESFKIMDTELASESKCSPMYYVQLILDENNQLTPPVLSRSELSDNSSCREPAIKSAGTELDCYSKGTNGG